MRRSQRLIATAVVIALSGALTGCGGGGMANFDPSDLLDFLDTKKKLPGERKPVFPEGVPGLEQGVPKDLYKGSRQEQIDQQNAAAAAGAPPAAGPPAKGAKSGGKQSASRPAPVLNPLPRQIPMLHRRKREVPPPRRRHRSRQKSCAAAPPRRHPIRRHNRRNHHNNLLRHSRHRCRAAPFSVRTRSLLIGSEPTTRTSV